MNYTKSLVIFLFVCSVFSSRVLAQKAEAVRGWKDALELKGEKRTAKLHQVIGMLEKDPMDTLYIFAMEELGGSYLQQSKYDSATYTYKQLLELSYEKSPEAITSKVGRAINDMGIAYYRLGKMDSAQWSHFISLAIYAINNDPQGKSFNYGNLGLIKKELGQKDSVIYYYDKGLAASWEAKDIEGVGYNHLKRAMFYAEDREIVNSLSFFQKAINTFEESGDENSLKVTNSRLASFYFLIGDFSSAKELYQQYYEESAKTDNMADRLRSCIRLANVYVSLEQLDSATHYMEMVKEILPQVNYARLKADAYSLEGKIQLRKGKYQKALESYQKSIQLVEGSNKTGEISMKMSEGGIYLQMGQPRKAIDLILPLLSENKGFVTEPTMLSGYKTLYLAFKQIGNSQKALFYLEKQDSLYKETTNRERSNEIARIEYRNILTREATVRKAEQAKKDLEYQQELTRQKWIQYAAFGSIAFILSIATVIYRSYQIKKDDNKKLTHQSEMLALKNEELQALREKEQELMEREREYMEESIADKERQIATTTMLSHEKNAILSQLQEQLKKVRGRIAEQEDIAELKDAEKLIQNNLNMQNSWESFVYQFENVHPRFFKHIKEIHPDITPSELKMAAYIRIGFGNKEIAQVSNLAISTVKKSVNRLKKKLNLAPEDDLRNYIFRLV